jgi:hypothetical protein
LSTIFSYFFLNFFDFLRGAKERRELAEKRENWVGWREGSIQKPEITTNTHPQPPVTTTPNPKTRKSEAHGAQ